MNESGAADPFVLQRFVDAQAPVLDTALAELAAGRKRTHWMWFVFPQLAALGRSATARHFGIGSRAEAVAFMQHPLLGPGLVRCAQTVLAAPAPDALALMGSPDDLKLRSSMTLFAAVAPGQPVFGQVIDRYFDGQPDALTIDWLAAHAD